MCGGGGGSSQVELAEPIKYAMERWLYGNVDGSGTMHHNMNTNREALQFPLTHYMNQALSVTPSEWDGHSDTWQKVANEPYGNPYVNPATGRLFIVEDENDTLDTILPQVQSILNNAGALNLDTQWNAFLASLNQVFTNVTDILPSSNNTITDYLANQTEPIPAEPSIITSLFKDAEITSKEELNDILNSADILSEEDIAEAVRLFAILHDRQIETISIPRFQTGMRDEGSVYSSSFVIGKAIIEEARNVDVAKFQSDLRIAAALKKADVDLSLKTKKVDAMLAIDELNFKIVDSKNQASLKILMANDEIERDYVLNRNSNLVTLYNSILSHLTNINIANLDSKLKKAVSSLDFADKRMQHIFAQFGIEKDFLHYYIEGIRIANIRKAEIVAANLDIREEAYLWDIKIFQAAANVLASHTGGTGVVPSRPSRAASVIGGALSGAATGAVIGSAIPGVGTAIGAGVGALLGAAGGAIS